MEDSFLLDDIIQFLKTERELYGDFSISNQKNSQQFFSAENNPEAPDEKSSDRFHFPKKKNNQKMQEQETDTAAESLVMNNKKHKVSEELSACNTLEQLYELCLKSENLKTDLKNTNLVFGTGNPNADLMLIGEAPGEQEDKKGEPFVGRAGQLLTKILKAINFQRSDVFITNILKHRPPKNRDPLPEERIRSLPYLYRQIDIISPRLILCLGKVSATTLLDRDVNLRDLRGKFHSFRDTELLVTYHPSALLRNQRWKRPAWEDVQLLRKRYDELNCSP